jgi:hypothetical protein
MLITRDGDASAYVCIRLHASAYAAKHIAVELSGFGTAMACKALVASPFAEE